jgi:hypothetical protein
LKKKIKTHKIKDKKKSKIYKEATLVAISDPFKSNSVLLFILFY